MNKAPLVLLIFSLNFLVFLLSPILFLTHAQLHGCGEIDLGSPGTDQQPPQQCQGNQSVTCNTVSVLNNLPYTFHTGINSITNITVDVWACDHAAPLVLFVPGRGRSAQDYARYENAIAKQGFTVAGINFGSLNDGNNLQTEAGIVQTLIDNLENESKLTGKISGTSVGLVGHSDGGLVATMEGYQGSNEPRIKAIIAADGFAAGKSSGPPLLLLHGTKDIKYSSPPSLTSYTANPKYHAEITGADHFCYVAEKSVPGYPIDCATAGLQQQTTALDALSGAFLQSQLYGCSTSTMSDVANQYKGVVSLQQSGNTNTPICATTTASVGKFTNPFPDGWIPNRLDMGYDGTFTNYIVAPFDGTITVARDNDSGWKYGGYMQIKAKQRPPGLPTSTIYFAEGILPLVHSGTVTAGQRIAKAVRSTYNGILGNIEFGVASDTIPIPYAEQPGFGTGNCPASSQDKSMVLNFSQWVQQNLQMKPPSQTGNAGCR